MSRKFVSDVIGNTYRTWDFRKPIIIHASMGTGKTYFVLNVLVPYVQSLGKKLVYIANRSALKQQVERSIPTKYQDSIVTCSYQQLPYLHSIRSKKVKDKRALKMDAIASADYYVLDEAHYFLADANFNTKVEACFRVLESLKRDNDSVWVYMTGTLPYLLLQLRQPRIDIPYLEEPKNYIENHIHSVKSLLKFKETKQNILESFQYPLCPYELFAGCSAMNVDLDFYPGLRQLSCFAPDYFGSKASQLEGELLKDISKHYHYYHIEQDFSYIQPIYFNKWEEIIETIRATPVDEKWIIFVRNKSDGKVLTEKIEDSVFITSEGRKNRKSNEYKVFKEIVDQAAFSQRVLIATKVLDNGINLKDSSLRHMVIDSFDETSFLQIVGRRRRTSESEQLKLYLKDEAEGTIRRQFASHILQILVFWYNLLKVRGSSRNLEYFTRLYARVKSKYLDDGKFKRPYEKYVEESNLSLSVVAKTEIAQDQALLMDMYRPASYPRLKFTYDYYKMMAMFEQAQNERFYKASKMGIKSETEYEQIQSELQKDQFMWLKQQLSWLGLNDTEHDPADAKHWITSQTGQAPESRQKLEAFLSTFESGRTLSINEEETLKQLFQNWIQNVRPRHKDAASKGSITVINRCFIEAGIPYQFKSKKKMIAKKQRNWWVIVKI